MRNSFWDILFTLPWVLLSGLSTLAGLFALLSSWSLIGHFGLFLLASLFAFAYSCAMVKVCLNERKQENRAVALVREMVAKGELPGVGDYKLLSVALMAKILDESYKDTYEMLRGLERCYDLPNDVLVMGIYFDKHYKKLPTEVRRQINIQWAWMKGARTCEIGPMRESGHGDKKCNG
jgi:hypothetical protein